MALKHASPSLARIVVDGVPAPPEAAAPWYAPEAEAPASPRVFAADSEANTSSPAPEAPVAPMAASLVAATLEAPDAPSAPVAGPDPITAAATPVYPAIYAFGGSLTDAGNDFIDDGGTSPVGPYSDGRFSNGPVWVQDLAVSDGLASLTPSLAGGTDYAYGGATTGAAGVDSSDVSHDLPAQLSQFMANVPHPVANALYTVEAGGNDLIAILKSSGDQHALADASVQAEITFINGLVSAGARRIEVLNVPDLGTSPEGNLNGPAAAQAATDLTEYYNSHLQSALISLALTDHISLTVVDAFTLIDQVIATPASYGFTNVTTPVWSGNPTNPNSGTLQATTKPAQDKFLFWDQLHPTEAGHAILAQAAGSIVLR